MRNRLLHKMTSLSGWETIARERLSEPLHLNLASLFVAAFGSLRAKVYFDLLVRQQHAYGLLTAADRAKEYGYSRVTVVEFGVASGAGIMNIVKISKGITEVTGVGFDIIGFDAATGMPPPIDYRDHPEYYASGDFVMQDPQMLKSVLPDNAKLIIGAVADTVPEFIETLSSEAPIGFINIDVDYYSSTVDSLKILTGGPENYLPLVEIYVDDVNYPGHSCFAGELLALEEFNNLLACRKITPANFLREQRLFKNASWISHMHRAHVFDHPRRATVRQGLKVTLGNPYLNIKTREERVADAF